MSLLASLHHHDATDVLGIVLLLAGVLAVLGGIYKLYLRDIPVGVVLVLVGVILLAVGWD
jgi:uncharacterized membrane protein HdeD (DUF308 family)